MTLQCFISFQNSLATDNRLKGNLTPKIDNSSKDDKGRLTLILIKVVPN